MWREVATDLPTEPRMHVNVATASHIKLKSTGDQWAVVAVHGNVESVLKGTAGEHDHADAQYVEIINEVERRANSAAIVAEHEAGKIIEQAAPADKGAFYPPRRIR
jgi:hypothetical protein